MFCSNCDDEPELGFLREKEYGRWFDCYEESGWVNAARTWGA